jgi:hypothetical protein
VLGSLLETGCEASSLVDGESVDMDVYILWPRILKTGVDALVKDGFDGHKSCCQHVPTLIQFGKHIPACILLLKEHKLIVECLIIVQYIGLLYVRLMLKEEMCGKSDKPR